MKMFDDIFRSNVEKVFSNYNAEHLADEGWDLFLAARKRRRKPGAGFPLWAKAASVVLIAGTAALTGYFIINRESTKDTLTASGTVSEKEAPVIKHTEPGNIDIPVLSEMPEPENENYVAEFTASLPEETVPGQSAETVLLKKDVIPSTIDATFLPEVADYRFQISGDSLNHIFEEALKKFRESQSVETMPADDIKRSGRTTFIAGVSGLLSHVANAASTPPGVAVGFYLEQKITSRISFRPGLALAMNSLGVDEGSGQHDFAYIVPLSGGSSGTLSSYNGQLNVIAMELPLNFIFNVYKRGRTGIYLAAGTSTMIYFSQQFTGDFVNEYSMSSLDEASGNLNTVTRYSTVSVDNSYGTLSRADLFGLANISAGYSLPYGKSGTMLIEPFLQLPVSDLTALNLRVRYGGISVKIRFGNSSNIE